MKSSIVAALLLALGLTVTAAEIPMKFGLINKTNTTMENGVVTVNNTDGKYGGVNCTVNINQTAPAKIILSGESICLESLTKSRSSHDYALYIDLTYMDGTKKYGFKTAFSTTAKEWQKKTVELNETKPIKQLRIYVHFRMQTGKVQFRNLKLEEVK